MSCKNTLMVKHPSHLPSTVGGCIPSTSVRNLCCANSRSVLESQWNSNSQKSTAIAQVAPYASGQAEARTKQFQIPPSNIMTPTISQTPTCERKPTLSDVHSCCPQDGQITSTCPFDSFYGQQGEFSRSDLDLMEEMGKCGHYCEPDEAKHPTPPCCESSFCDFDFDPTLNPSDPHTCLEGSACFDFACLDESCLEYTSAPCSEPGCVEPIATECDDPDCEDASPCIECLDRPVEQCTTCCMSDVCPHPSHAHYSGHHNLPPVGYVSWHRQPHVIDHQSHHSTCSSRRSSIEPRLNAALQNSSSYGYESSPTTTNPRSTPTCCETPHPETPQRGGHRRLQGAAAQGRDGYFVCHWTTGPLTGNTCGQFFSAAKGLHEHIQSTHFTGSTSNHTCLWLGCDSGSFNTKPKLARHLHSHTEYKPHKCDYPGCSLSFVTQQQRDVHRKKHTGEKPFACPECGKAFAYMDLLKSHLRSGVHGRADKKFACAICNEGFSDSSNRTKHTKSVHDPATGVPCPEPGCAYVDTRREKLRQHCEHTAHALPLVRSPREWEDYFNSETLARKPNKTQKRKR